jgi:hypothetical protein
MYFGHTLMSCAPNFYILIEMIAAFPQLFGRFNRYKPVIKKTDNANNLNHRRNRCDRSRA